MHFLEDKAVLGAHFLSADLPLVPLTGRGGSRACGPPSTKHRFQRPIVDRADTLRLPWLWRCEEQAEKQRIEKRKPKDYLLQASHQTHWLILVANPRQVVRSFGCLQKTTKVAIAQGE
jgi:hypothetical protein